MLNFEGTFLNYLAREGLGKRTPVGRGPGLGSRAIFPRRGVGRRRVGAARAFFRSHRGEELDVSRERLV